MPSGKKKAVLLVRSRGTKSKVVEEAGVLLFGEHPECSLGEMPGDGDRCAAMPLGGLQACVEIAPCDCIGFHASEWRKRRLPRRPTSGRD
jgi:hypothetical protein